MTKNEAVMLGELMKDVVEYGTASAFLRTEAIRRQERPVPPNMMKRLQSFLVYRIFQCG